MWTRILVGAGLFLLGHYIRKQVEQDAPTREWLRQRREEKGPQSALAEEPSPEIPSPADEPKT
jgi:hypothetical protein